MARGETSETRGVNPTQVLPEMQGGAGGWTVCCVHAHVLPSGPTVVVALNAGGVVPLKTYRLCGHGRGGGQEAGTGAELPRSSVWSQDILSSQQTPALCAF